MIPTEGRPQVLVLRDQAEVRAAMKHARVSIAGIDIMQQQGPVPGGPRRRPEHPRRQHPQAGDAGPRGRGGHLARGLRVARRAGRLPHHGHPGAVRAAAAQAARAALRAASAWPTPSRRRSRHDSGGTPRLRQGCDLDGGSADHGHRQRHARLVLRRRRDTATARRRSTPGCGWRGRAPPSSTWEANRRVRAPTSVLAGGGEPAGAAGGQGPGRVTARPRLHRHLQGASGGQGARARGLHVNDISALRMDPEMVAVVRDADCPVILMHMLGEPKTMQVDPHVRGRGRRGLRLLRGETQLGGRPGAEGREPADRPGHRLRQDDGAQPRDCSATSTRFRSLGVRWWWAPRASASWARSSA